ncbi:MAG: penicillin-binding transpeptidase domain-containing protein [Patescibacteria group bacterium]
MFWKRTKNFANNKDIEPDEIFLDSKNLPGFDRELFEGRLESPVSPKIPYVVFVVFSIIAAILAARLFQLQIINADYYRARAENNRMVKLSFPAERGLIYDRDMKELVWNASEGRAYLPEPGLSHILGYLGYSEEIKNGKDYAKKTGRAGIEKAYENILGGKDGLRYIEEDARGQIVSQSMEFEGEKGSSVVLTVDAGLQSELFRTIGQIITGRGFSAGSGAIIDVSSGEILALTSWPEINSQIFSRGLASSQIETFLKDERKPFFFRALEGVYPPGSVFKTIVALGALSEKIIDPQKEIFSAGRISIANPYFPDSESVFYDWKAHGWVNMRRAIAVSSNVYFYTIGGGLGDQAGLGVRKIIEYAKKIGLGQKIGLELPEADGFLPTPEWKEKYRPDDPVWRIGDTYNLSIGQGMVQVTPLQMAQVAAIIAREGEKPRLHLAKALITPDGEKKLVEEKPGEKIDIFQEAFKIVKEGMREAVSYGTASALSGLGVEIAGKTGTAEVGTSGQKVNSWFIGFLPYEKPKLALAIVLEKGSSANLVGAVAAAREIIPWMLANRPEFFRNAGSF